MSADLPATSASQRALQTALVIALVLLCLPHQAYQATQVVSNYRLLDRSWQYSMPVLLMQGEVAGRDFIYTYGPLYQALHAPVLLIPGCDLALLMRFHDLPEVVLSLAAVWLMLGWVGAHGWTRLVRFAGFALLVAAPEEFHGAHLKPVGALLLLALAARWLAGSSTLPPVTSRVLALLAFAAVPPVLSLYSFELGPLALATLLLLCVLLVAVTWRVDTDSARELRLNAVLAGGAALAGALVAALLTLVAPGWSMYLNYQAQLAEAYSVAMAAPLEAAGLALLVGSALVGATTIVLVFAQLRIALRAGNDVRALLILLVIACASLVFIRYGLTRSGLSHIYRATMPSLLLLLCLIPGFGLAQQPARRWPYALVGLAVFVVLLQPAFADGWRQRLAAWRQAGIGPTVLAIAEPSLAAVSETLRSRPEEAVAVYPHGAVLNLLSGKKNACATLQFTEGAIGPLAVPVIDRLEQSPRPLVALLRNPAGVAPESIATRNSSTFLALLAGYQLATPPTQHLLLLTPRATDDPAWRAVSLLPSGVQPSFAPDGLSALRIPFARDIQPRVSDFLRLQIRLAATPRLLGKPGELILVLTDENGRREVRLPSVAADGQPHPVLVTGLTPRDPMFASFFQPDRWWRSTERVVALELTWRPIDFMSSWPAEITVEAIDVLERENVETRDTPLDEQRSRAVREWCFGPR